MMRNKYFVTRNVQTFTADVIVQKLSANPFEAKQILLAEKSIADIMNERSFFLLL